MSGNPSLEIRSALQYRDLVSCGYKLFVAGGKDGMTGPRSSYCASVACFDLRNGACLWETSLPKSHPFTCMAANEKYVLVTLPFNFVREPRGLFAFRVEDGERIAGQLCPAQQVVLDRSGRFLVANTEASVSAIREIELPEGSARRELQFGNRSATHGSIDALTITSDDALFVTFASAARLASSIHELWRWGESSPEVTIRERDRRACVPVDGFLITGDTVSSTGGLTLYEQKSGKRVSEVLPRRGQLYAFAALSHRCVVAAFLSGEIARIDFDRQQADGLAHFPEEPDWRRIELLDSNHIAVMDTGNYRNPYTYIRVMELNSE